jgi:hypothetical protein
MGLQLLKKLITQIFFKLEGFLPYSQEPTIFSCSETDEHSSHLPIFA